MNRISDPGYLGELKRYLADLGGHSSDFIFQPETARTLQNWFSPDTADLDLDIDVTPTAFRHGFRSSANLQDMVTTVI